MNPHLMAVLAICLAAFLWGLDGVVLTPRLYNLPLPFVVFLVHALPFALMQIFLRRCWGDFRRLPAAVWLNLLLVALTGGVIGTLAIVKALFLVEFNQLSVVVLLQKLQPLFAILLAALLLKERITARFLGWAALAVAGGYLLTFGWHLPSFQTDERELQAAAWALLAAAAFGSATVLGKKLLASFDFWQATFARYGLTTAILALVLVVSGIGFPLHQVTGLNWAVILTIALTTGTGAIMLYYWGLTRVRAAVAALGELFLPISAVFLDYLVNDSRLTLFQLLGAAIMIGAITRVSLDQGKRS